MKEKSVPFKDFFYVVA